MLFKRKFVLYPVLLSSTLILSACNEDDDDGHTPSACNEGAKEVTTSDDRTLCVNLAAFKAEAPFTAGFMAPGKTTHTVFISDKDGNPIDVSSDDVVTEITQYPFMTMNSGHKHSAPYKHADESAAEYGAYNFDVYYPMASVDMSGDSMGTWEYRVMITDNNGTADDATDDKTHTVSFEPTVKMNMSTKAFRAVSKNENDKFKSSMDLVSTRRYSAWLESLGTVADGVASVKLYLTTEEMDHSSMSMKPGARDMDHDHGDMDMDSSDTDSQTYPAVYAPMDMDGMTMKVTLHGEDGTTAVDVDTVEVKVSTDDGANWTMLMGGMTHDELGYYSSASVPMTAGDVTMLVQVTVNGNIMTKTGAAADGTDADAMPALKFIAAAAE